MTTMVRELNMDELAFVSGAGEIEEITVTADAPSNSGSGGGFVSSGSSSGGGFGGGSSLSEQAAGQIAANGTGVPYSSEAIFYAEAEVVYHGPQEINYRDTALDLVAIAGASVVGLGGVVAEVGAIVAGAAQAVK